MSDQTIALPSKPKVVSEDSNIGIYEIDGLYPGYGHTLGNSLRRVILSSLQGAAITNIKIDGVPHEFSTIEGIKEDVINIVLNIKKIRLSSTSSDPIKLTLKATGQKLITAGDIIAPSQVTILNPELTLCTITSKNGSIDMELTVETGLGYVPKESISKDRVEVGSIALDAIFTPIRRVSYETENMRVGDRTDFNRLRINIETDGTITPKEALEKAIDTMINQLRSIVGFKEEFFMETEIESSEEEKKEYSKEIDEDMEDFLKTRIESLDLSSRTVNALVNANIRTVGGLARKKEEDILDIEGLGSKGLEEVKKLLVAHSIELK